MKDGVDVFSDVEFNDSLEVEKDSLDGEEDCLNKVCLND